MSLFVDIKYISLLSSQLENFKQISDYTWNFRCPICGDSKKSKSKTRGYVYKNSDSDSSLIYKCHNCSVSISLSNFIKELNGDLYRQYKLEKFKNKSQKNIIKKKKKLKFNYKKTDKINLKNINELDNEHLCKRYIINREIPINHYSNLYYAEHFGKWVNSIRIDEKYKNLLEIDDRERLVIPFFNTNGELIAAQGRSLSRNPKIRYITVRFVDIRPIFGLERWNKNQKTYIVEGPIDSLFLPNCLASCNSSLADAVDHLRTIYTFDINNIVLVFDNEPRNKEILMEMDKGIDRKYNICVWPDSIKSKDLNDMVKTNIDVKTIIDNNSFSGLKSKLNFNNWKLVNV